MVEYNSSIFDLLMLVFEMDFFRFLKYFFYFTSFLFITMIAQIFLFAYLNSKRMQLMFARLKLLSYVASHNKYYKYDDKK